MFSPPTTGCLPPLPILTDRETLARLRSGDSSAFDAIFRSEYGLLVGMAERLLGERALAEEVAQEVLMELWRRRESLVIEESLRAYLIRSARNRALNQLRHERVRRDAAPYLDSPRSASPDAPRKLEDAEIDAALYEAIASLPPRCREVFELSRVQRLRYGEIAVVLGVSTKAVEAQMGKALRILRERMAPWLTRDAVTPHEEGPA